MLTAGLPFASKEGEEERSRGKKIIKAKEATERRGSLKEGVKRKKTSWKGFGSSPSDMKLLQEKGK